MTPAEALLIAFFAWGAYAYHSMGALLIIDHSAAVPRWLRRALLPRPSSTGWLRVVSLAWVTFVAIISQALIVGILIGRSSGYALSVQAIYWFELIAALAWTVMLGKLTQPIRSRSSAPRDGP
jgi:hypothetical protein